MEQATTNVQVIPADKKKIMGIWKIAGLLFIITVIEYAFAFMMDAGTLRNIIFIGLTLVKAFYIVSEFMHLGHEVKGLIYSFVLPFAFLLWLIGALVSIEGKAIKETKGIIDFEGDAAKVEHVDDGH